MGKVIVIDDQPGMLRLSARVLEAAGHTVVGYQNGHLAIEDMQTEPPDLLITDIFMPEMEGLEIIRAVRALSPNLPIIAVSGSSYESPDFLKFAKQFGAVAGLRKPFRPAELVALVNDLLTR